MLETREVKRDCEGGGVTENFVIRFGVGDRVGREENARGVQRVALARERNDHRDWIVLEVSMVQTMFVVADQSKAQLYMVRGSRVQPELEEVEELLHPEGQVKVDPSDSSGHLVYLDSKGAEEEEERRFIRQLVDRLKKGQRQGEFKRLYIVAPARFVGKIRGLYGNALAQSIEREIIGDYTQQNRHKLKARVQNWLS